MQCNYQIQMGRMLLLLYLLVLLCCFGEASSTLLRCKFNCQKVSVPSPVLRLSPVILELCHIRVGAQLEVSGLGGWQATLFPGACIAGILISDSRAVASHPHMDRCSSWAARVASSTVICCSSVRPCGQCFLIWCSNRLHAQVTWAVINCF
jgi:hypothetical protein